MAANPAVVEQSVGGRGKATLGRRVRLAAAKTSLLLSTTDRLEIYEQFRTFTESKYPLDTVLERLWKASREEKEDIQFIYEEVYRDMRSGSKKFSEAIAPFVPAAERVMISVGEDSGNVSKGFAEAAFVCDVVAKIRAALVGELAYPVILLAFVSVIIVFIAGELAPNLESILDRPLEEWPILSRYLFYTNNVITGYGVFILAGLAAIAVIVMRSLARWTGRVRLVVDQFVPPWSIYREYQASVFVMALGALLRAGRPTETAVVELARIASPWLRWHTTMIAQSLMASQPAGVAIKTGMLSKKTVGYLKNFDSFGAFREGLDAMGRRGVDRAIKNVRGQAQVLRLIVYLMIGAAIVLVYGGALQPGKQIYDESRPGASVSR